MNFDFSDDQKLLRDQARKFLFDKCDRKSVRTILDDDQLYYHKELWSQISEMGWTGTAIPEEYGGLGLGMLELCVIAEELGRSLAPTPFSSSIYLFAEFIKNYGSEDQKKKFLPLIASGEKIGTFALSETNGTPKPSNVKTEYSSEKINGYKSPVSDGETADYLIIAANSDNKGNRNSLSLYIVDLHQDGVSKTSLETIDPTRPACSIKFENVKAELLGEQGMAWDMTENIFNRAAVLYSFEQVGGAQVSLDEAKKYSMERFAFGRQIGSYQAVKHKLADMYIKIELAKSNSYYGAMMLNDNGADLKIAAAASRVAATDAFNFAAQENIQTHGGIGFTWEADTQFYYRRSQVLGLSLGSIASWKNKLVTQLEEKNN